MENVCCPNCGHEFDPDSSDDDRQFGDWYECLMCNHTAPVEAGDFSTQCPSCGAEETEIGYPAWVPC